MRAFETIVPAGCSPNSKFIVECENDTYEIICPDGSTPGDFVVFEANDEIASKMQNDENSSRPATKTLVEPYVYDNPVEHEANVVLIGALLLFIVICFALLTAGYAEPRFMYQNLDDVCGITNPADGTIITRLYYSIYNGLGSSPSCEDSTTNFCLNWETARYWEGIDSVTNAKMYQEAKHLWPTFGVMLPLASAFLAVAGIQLIVVMTTSSHGWLFSASLFIILAWILALAGTPYGYAYSLSPFWWRTFYESGVTFDQLINDVNLVQSPISLPTGCDITVTYGPGATMMATAMALLFFLMVFLLISCCFMGCFLQPDPLTGRRRSYYLIHSTINIAAPSPAPQPRNINAKDVVATRSSNVTRTSLEAGTELPRATNTKLVY
jgi:hypothetical protein